MGTSFFYPYLRDHLPTELFQAIWLYFLIPSDPYTPNPILNTKAFYMNLLSPIGISSGIDINGLALSNLLNFGSGFVEIGPILPYPEGCTYNYYNITETSLQKINPITSYGTSTIRERLSEDTSGPRGLNFLVLRETVDTIPHMTDDDLQFSLIKLFYLADYITINLSETNFGHTLYYQHPYKYQTLLRALSKQRDFEIGLFAAYKSGLLDFFIGEHRRMYIPIYIKINADWDNIEELVDSCIENGIDGLIVGDENDDPVISRKLLEKTTKIADGRLEIISYGGIKSGSEVLERIKSGAKAVQIFSVLLCKGPWELRRIENELVEKIREEGFGCVEDAFNFYNRR